MGAVSLAITSSPPPSSPTPPDAPACCVCRGMLVALLSVTVTLLMTTANTYLVGEAAGLAAGSSGWTGPWLPPLGGGRRQLPVGDSLPCCRGLVHALWGCQDAVRLY